MFNMQNTALTIAGGAETFVHLYARPSQRLPVANLITQVRTAPAPYGHIPVSFNDIDDAPTCQINCPSVGLRHHILGEGRQRRPGPLARAALGLIARLAAPFLRCAGWDHQVQINNWLVSTNPTGDLDIATARALTEHFADRHPSRAIVLRSLNDLRDIDLLYRLPELGFRLIPVRRVHLQVPADHPLAPEAGTPPDTEAGDFETGDFKTVDGRDFSHADFRRVEALYRDLHAGRAATLRPLYTAEFLEALVQTGVIQMTGLRDTAGTLQGIVAVLVRGDTMVIALRGYDPAHPSAAALGRLIVDIPAREAARRGLYCNHGAVEFSHGCDLASAIEYFAVCDRHLPRRRRLAGALIERVARRLAAQPTLQQCRVRKG